MTNTVYSQFPKHNHYSPKGVRFINKHKEIVFNPKNFYLNVIYIYIYIRSYCLLSEARKKTITQITKARGFLEKHSQF